MGGFVDRLGVVRTVRGDRGHGVGNLLKQGRDLSTVMRPVSGQIRRDDLTCISIDNEVRLPPSPSLWRFPQMADVNSEPRTIDQQMDRPTRREPAEPDLTELL